MDYLWTPWRYRYVADPAKNDRCVLCAALQQKDDAAALIVLRGEKNFVILNRFPYTAGHVMIVPYLHVGELSAVEAATLAEMMQLAQKVQRALAAEYKPEGFNLGMNLGRCAGAGVHTHLHLHLLPRWTGDTNFMMTAGETRVLPEDLSQTYARLRRALATEPGK
jgi:ATP adenylyltransferase